ncbi:MAG: MBL fold metallo-hydrolase [Ignavibacteriae bacterium]|nr:MBL fold metallo-hydrolase [Ignavibacteriota bacterium]
MNQLIIFENMRKSAFLFLFFIFLISGNHSFLSAQDKLPPPKVRVMPVDSGLYVINISGTSNIVSIGIDGVLIVDSNYDEYGLPLRAEIEKLGGKGIVYIINTHWHFDHAGGNKTIGKDAKIIAHKYTAELLSSDQMLMGEIQKAYPDFAIPKITIDDTYELNFNGEKIKIIPVTGGHTGGDVVVYFESANTVHIGDIIFSDMFPFVDTEHGGNVRGIPAGINKIVSAMPADVTIIPSHGKPYNIDQLKKYGEIIAETISIVDKEIAKGKSLEEIKKANVLSEYKDFEKAFSCDDWIEFIYESKKSE